MNEPTDMHGPTDDAPFVTNSYAKCAVCNFQWQIKGENHDDAKGCSACGAPADAITTHYEGPSGTEGRVGGGRGGCWVGGNG